MPHKEAREAAKSGKVNDELVAYIQQLLTDRPVAYHPVLADLVGSVTGAVFLSQLMYWAPRTTRPDGFIYKTRDEIYQETALTRYEQEGARKALRGVGVITEKLMGVPAVMHYRVDWQCIATLLRDYDGPFGIGARLRDQPPGGSSNGRGSGATGRSARRGKADPPGANKPEEVPPTSWGNFPQLDGGTITNQLGEISPTITETTTPITTESDVVVGALRDRGISAPVAERLAAYPADYVLAKCEQVDWLAESKSRAVGKNAAGYLRRAIEEDYAPPPHYRSRAEREAEAAERAKEAAEEAARLQELEAEEQRARELDFAVLAQRYPPQPIPGTALTTTEAWEQTLDRLQAILSRPNFEMVLRGTLLLRCDGEVATIGARTAFDAEQLTSRLDRHITPALGAIIGRPIRCTYMPLTAVVDEDPLPEAAILEPVVSHRARPRRSTPTGRRV